MNYIFNILLTDKDYFELNKFYMLKSKYGKKQRILFRWFFIIAILFVSLFSLCGGNFSAKSFIGIIPYFLVLGLLFCCEVPFTYLIIKLQLKIMKKSGKMPFSSTSVMEFNDEGFLEKTSVNTTEYKYTAVEQVYIIENKMIYIFVNSIMAYIIPEKSFEAENQYKSFVEFLSSKNIPIHIIRK